MYKYFVFLILCTIAVPAFSQQFEGGFFGGFSASQIDGDLFSGYNKIGITAGAYITRKINRNFNLKTEIRFIQKGAFKRNTENDPTLFKTSLQYAEVPILLQYFHNKKLFFEAGLVPEVLLTDKEEDQDGLISYEPYNRFSLEGTAGIGYFFNNNLALGARHNYSLLPVRDHASGQSLRLNRGQYNSVISFSLYYHFR